MGKQGLVAPVDQVGGLGGELVGSGELQDDLPGFFRSQGAGRAARADPGVLDQPLGDLACQRLELPSSALRLRRRLIRRANRLAALGPPIMVVSQRL